MMTQITPDLIERLQRGSGPTKEVMAEAANRILSLQAIIADLFKQRNELAAQLSAAPRTEPCGGPDRE